MLLNQNKPITAKDTNASLISLQNRIEVLKKDIASATKEITEAQKDLEALEKLTSPLSNTNNVLKYKGSEIANKGDLNNYTKLLNASDYADAASHNNNYKWVKNVFNSMRDTEICFCYNQSGIEWSYTFSKNGYYGNITRVSMYGVTQVLSILQGIWGTWQELVKKYSTSDVDYTYTNLPSGQGLYLYKNDKMGIVELMSDGDINNLVNGGGTYQGTLPSKYKPYNTVWTKPINIGGLDLRVEIKKNGEIYFHNYSGGNITYAHNFSWHTTYIMGE